MGHEEPVWNRQIIHFYDDEVCIHGEYKIGRNLLWY